MYKSRFWILKLDKKTNKTTNRDKIHIKCVKNIEKYKFSGQKSIYCLVTEKRDALHDFLLQAKICTEVEAAVDPGGGGNSPQ